MCRAWCGGFRKSRKLSQLCWRACARLPSVPVAESRAPETQILFQEVIKSISFPVIFTDDTGRPRAWRRVGIDARSISNAEIERTDPRTVQSGPIRRLVDLAAELDRHHPPIPLKVLSGGDSVLVGHVHYGDSKIIDELRWMPFVQVLIVGLFVLVGWMGFRSIRANEERAIWVGMARETAHQLGTPLSALLGWLEVLRTDADREGEFGSGGGPADEPEETRASQEREAHRKEALEAIATDVARLELVASRFSKIGTRPRMETISLTAPVEETVAYFRRRLPTLGKNVDIRLKQNGQPLIQGDRELLRWALENLIRNAIDAMDKQRGSIVITIGSRSGGREAEILVSDNGRGIPPREQRRIFRSGYTTKSIGWGLGLSLSRRIVEDYHQGKLILKSSKVGMGSVFQILLPAIFPGKLSQAE